MEPAQRPSPVTAIFADAWGLYEEAIEILESGKPRIAAEVAWGATKRATDALILARTERLPSGTGQTSTGIRDLAHSHPEFRPLRQSFREAVRELHANCFYLGNFGRPGEISRIIRATEDYIRDAIGLSGL